MEVDRWGTSEGGRWGKRFFSIPVSNPLFLSLAERMFVLWASLLGPPTSWNNDSSPIGSSSPACTLRTWRSSKRSTIGKWPPEMDAGHSPNGWRAGWM
jgi:hypothetical protein